jgi:hypothetical protein
VHAASSTSCDGWAVLSRVRAGLCLAVSLHAHDAVMLCVSLCAFVWVFVQTTAVPAVVFVLLACIVSIALVMVSLQSCVRLVDGSLDVLSKLLWVEWWNVLP